MESATEDTFPDPPIEVQQVRRWIGRVTIREPADIDAPPRGVPKVHGKGKEKATEELEVSSSDDEGICYCTFLDHLPIPENLFSGTNSFNIASSDLPFIGDSNSSSSGSLN